VIEVSGGRRGLRPSAGAEGISLSIGAGELVTVIGGTVPGSRPAALHPRPASRDVGPDNIRGFQDITRLPTEKIVRLGLTLVPETRERFPDLS